MIAFVLGFRELFSLICLILCVFVAATIALEFYRGARVIRAQVRGIAGGFRRCELTMRNTRRYGGYIVHLGMVFVFIGLSGAAFNHDVQKEMHFGDTLQIGPYTLLLQTIDTKPEKNYTAQRMIVEVLKGNRPQMMLYPEKRQFASTEQTGTMVAIHSTLKEDLYVVFAGLSPDTQLPVIHAYLNPLVKWIWFGGVVVVFGTLVALLPNRRDVLVLAGAHQPARQALPQRLSPSLTLREGHD